MDRRNTIESPAWCDFMPTIDCESRPIGTMSRIWSMQLQPRQLEHSPNRDGQLPAVSLYSGFGPVEY